MSGSELFYKYIANKEHDGSIILVIFANFYYGKKAFKAIYEL